MNLINRELEVGGDRPPTSIKIWDLFVRAFHWSLVVLFAVAILTGDEIEWLHLWAGYAIAAFITMRIVWGFIGPEKARFSSFVRGPRAILTFLEQSLRLKAPRYLGHNPAGGAMIVILMVLLAALCVTGFAMTTDAYWGSAMLEIVHEALAYITLTLVGLHVTGVIIASIEHGENLAKAMLTGRKRPE